MITDSTCRIYLLDDQQIIRQAISDLLEGQPSFHVIGADGNPETVWEEIQIDPPDVLIIDILTAEMGGIRFIERVRDHRLGCRCLVLTRHNGDAAVGESIRAGAMGYINKNATVDELFSAIRTVWRGEHFLSPRTASLLAANSRHPGLSVREHEVLMHMARGISNGDIAKSIDVSEGTVKSHVGSVLCKLEAANRTEAVLIAAKRGLVYIN